MVEGVEQDQEGRGGETLPPGGSRPADWVPENASLQNLRTCGARRSLWPPSPLNSADGAVPTRRHLHSLNLVPALSLLAGVALTLSSELANLDLDSSVGLLPPANSWVRLTDVPSRSRQDSTKVSIPDRQAVGTKIHMGTGRRQSRNILLGTSGLPPNRAGD